MFFFFSFSGDALLIQCNECVVDCTISFVRQQTKTKGRAGKCGSTSVWSTAAFVLWPEDRLAGWWSRTRTRRCSRCCCHGQAQRWGREAGNGWLDVLVVDGRVRERNEWKLLKTPGRRRRRTRRGGCSRAPARQASSCSPRCRRSAWWRWSTTARWRWWEAGGLASSSSGQETAGAAAASSRRRRRGPPPPCCCLGLNSGLRQPVVSANNPTPPYYHYWQHRRSRDHKHLFSYKGFNI